MSYGLRAAVESIVSYRLSDLQTLTAKISLLLSRVQSSPRELFWQPKCRSGTSSERRGIALFQWHRIRTQLDGWMESLSGMISSSPAWKESSAPVFALSTDKPQLTALTTIPLLHNYLYRLQLMVVQKPLCGFVAPLCGQYSWNSSKVDVLTKVQMVEAVTGWYRDVTWEPSGGKWGSNHCSTLTLYIYTLFTDNQTNTFPECWLN